MKRSRPIQVGDIVTCIGEGLGAYFRVAAIHKDWDMASLETLSGRDRGDEALRKLKRAPLGKLRDALHAEERRRHEAEAAIKVLRAKISAETKR